MDESTGNPVLEVVADEIVINEVSDALDLIGECWHRNVDKIIIREENIHSDFFNLSTGLAGEILQKFTTYNIRIAIVGDFAKYPGKSLKDFIYESNKSRRINFVASIDEARKQLTMNN